MEDHVTVSWGEEGDVSVITLPKVYSRFIRFFSGVLRLRIEVLSQPERFVVIRHH